MIPLMGGGEEIEQELNSLLREIGEEGSSLQCLLWADPRTDRFLDLWAKPRHEKGGIFGEVAKKKRHFLQQGAKPTSLSPSNSSPSPRIFRCLISYSVPKNSSQDSSLLLDRLVRKKQKTLEILHRLTHRQAFEVGPLSFIELLSGLLNPDLTATTQGRSTWNRHTWLSAQVGQPGTALEVQPGGLLFHAKKEPIHSHHPTGDLAHHQPSVSPASCLSHDQVLFKTYEVIDYPDQWSLSLMGQLIGDFFNPAYRLASPFYLHYGIYFPPQSPLETKLRGKAKILDHQMKFPALVRMFPEMPREREEHLLVHRQLLEGEKFVETRFSCGLWADPVLHSASESTFFALFQKYGFKLAENHFIHLPDFLSSLPMAGGEEVGYLKNLKRTRCFRTTLTSETSRLMPLLGEWWGNSTNGMILMGRRGQMAAWDPFAEDGNLNMVVVGPSGSGKSVFMQDLMTSHLGQGGRVFVLDLGRSFQKLCTLLQGQYVEFSTQSRLNLNPFSCVKTDQDQESLDVALSMVASIVATMAMPSHQIDKERADLVNSLVKKAWEKQGRSASIDTLLELLEEAKFQSELMTGAAESLKEGLKKYSRSGSYAQYFYGDQEVQFNQDLVVIETEELKNMADLQAVILQIFTLTISSQIFMGDRSRRSLICIDEAWDLLKSPQMEGFIESLARRLRKYNGALVVGTQSLKDFDRSLGAKAAFNNSNWLLMLGRDQDSINTLKRENLIPLDGFKERALGSLRMEAGNYSEVFIYHKGTGFFSINQLKLDPFSAMLYSTKAEEFQAVQELMKEGWRIEQALDWLISHQSKFKQLLSQGYSIKKALAKFKEKQP